jgi:hypothetical protein
VRIFPPANFGRSTSKHPQTEYTEIRIFFRVFCVFGSQRIESFGSRSSIGQSLRIAAYILRLLREPLFRNDFSRRTRRKRRSDKKQHAACRDACRYAEGNSRKSKLRICRYHVLPVLCLQVGTADDTEVIRSFTIARREGRLLRRPVPSSNCPGRVF